MRRLSHQHLTHLVNHPGKNKGDVLQRVGEQYFLFSSKSNFQYDVRQVESGEGTERDYK